MWRSVWPWLLSLRRSVPPWSLLGELNKLLNSVVDSWFFILSIFPCTNWNIGRSFSAIFSIRCICWRSWGIVKIIDTNSHCYFGGDVNFTVVFFLKFNGNLLLHEGVVNVWRDRTTRQRPPWFWDQRHQLTTVVCRLVMAETDKNNSAKSVCFCVMVPFEFSFAIPTITSHDVEAAKPNSVP